MLQISTLSIGTFNKSLDHFLFSMFKTFFTEFLCTFFTFIILPFCKLDFNFSLSFLYICFKSRPDSITTCLKCLISASKLALKMTIPSKFKIFHYIEIFDTEMLPPRISYFLRFLSSYS